MKKRSAKLYYNVCDAINLFKYVQLTTHPGSIESEEDFSWEDEDESTPPTAVLKAAAPTSPATHSQTVISVPSSGIPTPATTSPRDSSEESYDVVSSDGAGKHKQGDKKTNESDEGESDWE